MKNVVKSSWDAILHDMFTLSQKKTPEEQRAHETLFFDEWYEENIQPKYTDEEYIRIGKAMVIFGGGFVRELGRTLLKADSENRVKMAICWKDYFVRYLIMAS